MCCFDGGIDSVEDRKDHMAELFRFRSQSHTVGENASHNVDLSGGMDSMDGM